MKVVFSAAARSQIHEIAASYAGERRGLGVDFIESVYRAVALIQAFPRIGAKVNDRYRKLILQRFPYVVIYSIEEDLDRLRVTAISHQRRDPDNWRYRIEEAVLSQGAYLTAGTVCK